MLVSSRTRYMAIWRASAIFLVREPADDVVERQIEVLGHLRDDVRGLDFHVGGEEVLQSLLRKGFGDRLVAQRRHGGHTVQRAFRSQDVLGEPVPRSG